MFDICIETGRASVAEVGSAAELAELCLPTVIACLAAVVAAVPFAEEVPATVPNTAVVPPASSTMTLPAVVAAPVAAAVVAIEVVPPAWLTNTVATVVLPAVATIACTAVQLTGGMEMLDEGADVGWKVGKPVVGLRLGVKVGCIEFATVFVEFAAGADAVGEGVAGHASIPAAAA